MNSFQIFLLLTILALHLTTSTFLKEYKKLSNNRKLGVFKHKLDTNLQEINIKSAILHTNYDLQQKEITLEMIVDVDSDNVAVTEIQTSVEKTDVHHSQITKKIMIRKLDSEGSDSKTQNNTNGTELTNETVNYTINENSTIEGNNQSTVNNTSNNSEENNQTLDNETNSTEDNTTTKSNSNEDNNTQNNDSTNNNSTGNNGSNNLNGTENHTQSENDTEKNSQTDDNTNGTENNDNTTENANNGTNTENNSSKNTNESDNNSQLSTENNTQSDNTTNITENGNNTTSENNTNDLNDTETNQNNSNNSSTDNNQSDNTTDNASNNQNISGNNETNSNEEEEICDNSTNSSSENDTDLTEEENSEIEKWGENFVKASKKHELSDENSLNALKNSMAVNQKSNRRISGEINKDEWKIDETWLGNDQEMNKLSWSDDYAEVANLRMRMKKHHRKQI